MTDGCAEHTLPLSPDIDPSLTGTHQSLLG